MTFQTRNTLYILTQTSHRGIYTIQGGTFFPEPTEIMIFEYPKLGEPFWVSPIEGPYKGRNSLHTSSVMYLSDPA